MATTLKWAAPEAIQTYFTTELNSLATSTSDTTGFSAVGSAIDNETDQYQYLELELSVAAQGSARSAGATVAVMIVASVDGTNYPADTDLAYAVPLATFGLDAATTARLLTRTGIGIPPCKFKLQVWQKTGQAFAASSSTLKYRRYNEQGA